MNPKIQKVKANFDVEIHRTSFECRFVEGNATRNINFRLHKLFK